MPEPRQPQRGKMPLFELVGCHDNMTTLQDAAYYKGFTDVVVEAQWLRRDTAQIQGSLGSAGIGFIPLVQGMGHHGPGSYDPACREAEGTTATCPVRRRTWDVLGAVLKKVLRPGVKRLHIGCDEVRIAAVCEDCRAAGLTPEEAYAGYINGCCQLARKISPSVEVMLWADNLCPHNWEGVSPPAAPLKLAGALKLIPKDVILCLWNYGPNPHVGVSNAWELSYAYVQIAKTVEWAKTTGHRFTGSPWTNAKVAQFWIDRLEKAKALGVIATNWGASRECDSVVIKAAYGE